MVEANYAAMNEDGFLRLSRRRRSPSPPSRSRSSLPIALTATTTTTTTTRTTTPTCLPFRTHNQQRGVGIGSDHSLTKPQQSIGLAGNGKKKNTVKNSGKSRRKRQDGPGRQQQQQPSSSAVVSLSSSSLPSDEHRGLLVADQWRTGKKWTASPQTPSTVHSKSTDMSNTAVPQHLQSFAALDQQP